MTELAKTAKPLNAEELESLYASWKQAMTGMRTTNIEAAETAVDRLYERCDKEHPAIFWCQSFYQMLTMPSLVIGILHSDMWELVAGESTKQSSGKQWEEHWNKIWPEIWLNAGMPLLRGMNRSSRIAVDYGHLEGALISQIKRELGSAVHCGRLDYLQKKLRREFYRLYWARHDIADDFARQHWAHLKHDIYDEAVYLRDQTFDWPGWRDLQPHDSELHAFGEGIASLFDMLASRLGAEPVAQAGFIIDLPAGLPWLATADLLARSFPERFHKAAADLRIWCDLAESTSAVVLLDGICFLCQRPDEFHITQRRRLHDAHGKALAYSDGFSLYAWEGVLVPPFVIEDPGTISVGSIERCDNAEVRRVMLERYGTTKYLLDANVVPVHTDDYGTLYRKEMPGDEPLVMVKVVNSTAEPDGTFKDYFLRVPPGIETAKAAVAWTFGFDEPDYDPSLET